MTHEPYVATAQQSEADRLGMWLFLASETMMFGGLFLVIAVVRWLHPAGAQVASHHLHLWIGAANTAVLLVSSLAVAIAVAAAEQGRSRAAMWGFVAAAALGMCFLGLKGAEYLLEYREHLMPGFSRYFSLEERGARLFMDAYFIATGLHALHLAIGIALLAGLALRIRLGRLALPERKEVPVMTGLYWHLVDILWVFLFPALYLVG